MTIQPIGSASVALYITPADLKEHGLTPAGLTLERALAITQTAFHEAGITLEGSIEIEYGSETYVLGPGESIYYDSIVPHQVRAHAGQNAKFLACVYTPF